MLDSTSTLDSTAAAYKESAGKLADLLREQASLKAELDKAACDADAADLSEFADIFRDMSARLTAIAVHNGKQTAPTSRRRGRPPKQAEDQSPVT